MKIRSSRRGSAVGRGPIRCRLRVVALERLEDRRLMAVNAFVESIGASNKLEVTLSAANDKVEIGSSGNEVTVKGTSFSGTSFSSVSRIDIRGSNARSQIVQLGGAVTIGSTLTIDAVSGVQFDGSWKVGALTITLSEQPGGIRGGGTIHAVGATRLRATDGDIILDGANTFDERVSIAAANNVSLTTTGRLFLARLLVLRDATFTSRTLQLEADKFDSLHNGTLTLQPFDATASIDIGGHTGDYALPESETLNHLNGFGRLTIGRTDGKHEITIGRRDSTKLFRSTTVRSPLGGSITVAKHGLAVNGPNLTLSAPKGSITLDGNVGLLGAGTLRFDGPVVIGTPTTVEVSTPKGDIAFTGPTNDDATPSTLELEADDGTISLGPVGGPSPTTRLGGLHIKQARDVNFGGQTRAAFVRQDIGLGTTTVGAGLDVQSSGTSVNINAVGIVLDGGIRAPGQTVQLRATLKGIDAKGDIEANQLLLLGTGLSILRGPNTAISVLAANLNGGLALASNRGDLTIGSVGVVHGIHTSGKGLTLLVQGKLNMGSAIDVGKATIYLAANSIQQSGRSDIARVNSGGLVIGRAASVQMNNQNRIATIAASVTGDLSFRDEKELTVGTVEAVPGIRTQGGNVALYSGGTLTVSAPINTTPGKDGKLIPQGDTRRIQVLVPPILGGGSVTLTSE